MNRILKWLWQRKLDMKYMFFVIILIFIWVLLPSLTQPFYWDTFGTLEFFARNIANNFIISDLNKFTIDWAVLIRTGFDYPHTPLIPIVYAIIYGLTKSGFILSAHLFSLLISVSLLAIFFICILKISNVFNAIISTVFLAFDPLFLAQTGLVYYEIPSLLFRILSLYMLLKEKRSQFVFFSVIAFLIRFENGFVLPLTTLIWFLSQKKPLINKLKLFFHYSWPVILSSLIWLGLFFNTNHWLISPEFGFEVHRFETLILFIENSFAHQGRLLFTLIILGLLPFTIRHGKQTNLKKFTYLLFLQGILTVMVFGSLGNTLMRYSLPLLPLIYLLFARTLSLLRDKKLSIPVYALAVIFLVVQINNWYSCKPNFEGCLSYLKWIETKIQIAGNISNLLPPGHILLTDWDFVYELRDQQILAYNTNSNINAQLLKQSSNNNDSTQELYVLVTPNTPRSFSLVVLAEKSGVVVARWGDRNFESILYEIQ